MAVQDAVAAANRLAGPLRAGKVTDEDLQAVEQRRTLPVRFTQWLQLTIQQRIISRVLAKPRAAEAAVVLEAVWRLSGFAPHSSAVDWASAFVPSTCKRPKRRAELKPSRVVSRQRASASA